MPNQRTLKKSIQTTGIGVHAGQPVQLTLHPAPVNTGIIFRRTDLNNLVEIPAKAAFMGDTDLCTCLQKNEFHVATVEHVLSALSALRIDNCYVDLTMAEVPILDGSAHPFVLLIQSAGITEQDAPRQFMRIIKPISVHSGDKMARLDPYDGFRVSFEIAYDHPIIAATEQVMTFDFSETAYINEISHARTFGFFKDYEMIRSKNLALGASLENTVVLDSERILNTEPLRYKNEFVRHKILDAVGDLFLLGYPIIGAYTGFKSGHALNGLLVKTVLAQGDAWELVGSVECRG